MKKIIEFSFVIAGALLTLGFIAAFCLELKTMAGWMTQGIVQAFYQAPWR